VLHIYTWNCLFLAPYTVNSVQLSKTHTRIRISQTSNYSAYSILHNSFPAAFELSIIVFPVLLLTLSCSQFGAPLNIETHRTLSGRKT
jgi:hypothetical protein